MLRQAPSKAVVSTFIRSQYCSARWPRPPQPMGCARFVRFFALRAGARFPLTQDAASLLA
jgi:hypothetical protein